MRSWREEEVPSGESGRYVSCNYGHNPSHGHSRHQIGFSGSSASLTDFVAVFRPVSGEFWPTYQRVWKRHTSKHCWDR